MDLQRELIESSSTKGGAKKGMRASAVSIALHGMLVAGIVYAGTHKVTHKVDAEKPITAFISRGAAPPPPPPPPPPPKSSSAPQSTPRVQPKPVVVPKITPMTPPVEIPKELPVLKTTLPTPTAPVVETTNTEPPSSGAADTGPGDAVNGVAGGVEGGVAGGIVGGEVGGTVGGEIGGVKGGEVGGTVGGQVGGTGTGTSGEGTGGNDAPVEPPSGPLRVGGNVKAPVAVSRAKPDYTDAARKAKVAGTVVV
ncbi:MAG TPA: hypothetical protein VJZ00_04965, partial [Thermoanaerobaculia bacterium]|nr:hypothetical protein [Thermoanaerobaculia bacterium]